MPSLIPGYEYDIFISYRQKDNKGDRWVSEFVEALKSELESTFKEEISVYCDINPLDGLLETHDVNASLEEKLKCLVFIPIISRTYCDPKSFAWENEFKAFVEQASKDRFGLKVRLPNGNVTSRVLPVRIHDLDDEDVKLCESVIGGFFRGVEFIYKEPGVNRPLRLTEDSPGDNLNKTFYRNQVNKVANAVKGIISGLKTEPDALDKEKVLPAKPPEEVKKDESNEVPEKAAKLTNWKMLSGVITIAALFIIAVLLAYPKIINNKRAAEAKGIYGDRKRSGFPLTGEDSVNAVSNPMGKTLVVFLENSAYSSFASLDGPLRDFNLMSNALINYQIHNILHKQNMSKAEMEKFFSIELRDFIITNRINSLLIWYSGHGKFINEVGYWIPTDANRDDEFTYFNVNALKASIETYSSYLTHILVVTDACEFGPGFCQTINSALKKRNCGDWLATQEKSSQAFSSTGYELNVDESPFTPVFYNTLLNNTRACISIEEIVAKVKVAVGSNNHQKPQFGKIAGLKDEGGTFFFITK